MKFKKEYRRYLFYFLISALLIMLFFPRELKFKYQFNVGKPWRYGLLTAPSDLPIYKTDSQIAAERDSILKGFKPYYKLDETIIVKEIAAFRTEMDAPALQQLPNKSVYIRYIEAALKEVYKRGILNTVDHNTLNSAGGSLMVVDQNNIAAEKAVTSFYTTIQAYRYVVDEAPDYLSHEQLIELDLERFIEENIVSDQALTERIRQEMLESIPLATGIVQAGERIIDRGVIVDEHTYAVLRSLKAVYEKSAGTSQRRITLFAGQLILILGLLVLFYFYIYLYHPPMSWRNSRSYLPFMATALIAGCLLTEFTVRFTLFNIYIIPFPIIPITICIFYDSRSAIFINTVTVLICSLIAPLPWEFIMIQYMTGLVAVYTIKDLSERSQLIKTAFFVFLTYCVIYGAIVLFQESDVAKIAWLTYVYFGVNFIVLLFVYVLIYILERIFGIVSNVTLVELSDINAPLMRVLSESCPGTFQHSLQVSFLSAEATRRIGGNAQLARTGALYHDIGKLTNPEFFTENQSVRNPHEGLAPVESAKIIIDHVNEGVKIARKKKIPEVVIDFIRMHHGTGKTKFFLTTLKNKHPEIEIDELLFTYPGPNPNTKEAAVVLLADSVEAASRSLKEYTEEALSNLVERIINSHIEDGLLKDAPITFSDVEVVKEVFLEKLKTMYHTRISYPEEKQP